MAKDVTLCPEWTNEELSLKIPCLSRQELIEMLIKEEGYSEAEALEQLRYEDLIEAEFVRLSRE